MKTIWYTTCEICNASISNAGSSRPKKYCSGRCRSKTTKRREQMRQYSNRRLRKQGVPLRVKRKSNRAILNAEKLRRGECELHQLYNNGERKFVVQGLEYLFDMDHVDRTQKHKTLAKMIGDPVERLLAEIAKCQLVCCECHRRKTVDCRDWASIVKVLEPDMKIVYDQPTLFDI